MKISENRLLLGNIPVETIMQQYGSPLYVYEESVLRSQFRQLSSGFPKDLVEIHYSMKANSNPSLLKIIYEEGASIDAVSEFEVRLAIESGFDPKQIIFTGNNNSIKEIEFCIGQKVSNAFDQSGGITNSDPDAALYDGFLQDEDRSRCLSFHEQRRNGAYPRLDFKDKRLPVLCDRLKMRSFSEYASDDEKSDWNAWVRQKLLSDGEHLNLQKFDSEIEQLRKVSMLTEQKHRLLDELLDYGNSIRTKYEIDDSGSR